MKRKLIISLLATASAIACAFGLAACGEKPHEHKYDSQVVAPTCTEQGYTTHTCACGDSYVDTYVNALGHSFTNYVSDGNATCTQDGTKTATCNRDGCSVTHTVTNTGSKLGHIFTDYVSDRNATCTQDGTKTATCNRNGCNVTDTVTDTGSKLGHSFTNYVSDENATCTEDGTKTATCDRKGCNITDTITDTDSKFGHSYGEPEWTWDGCESATATFKCIHDNSHVETVTASISSAILYPVTCTTDGVNTYTATVEFNNYTFYNYKHGTVAKTGHTYGEFVEGFAETCTQNGMVGHYQCSVCNLYFDEDKNEINDIVIPAKHQYGTDNICTICGDKMGTEGLEYTLSDDGKSYICSGIGTATYANNIVIATSFNQLPVRSIGEKAFYSSRCKEITSITIPDSVTTIEKQAFRDCYGLISIYIGKGVKSIQDNAFYGCRNLTNIYYAGDMAGWCGITGHCWIMDDVLFDPNRNLFINNEQLAGELIIPDGVTTIEDNTFYNCDYITSVIIPEHVTSIGGYAFQNCDRLQSVTIGSGIKTISTHLFYNCDNLTSVIIPDSVTSIGYEALRNCDNLTNITYTGTMAQWKTIEKGIGWEPNMISYTVTCTDGTLDRAGNVVS